MSHLWQSLYNSAASNLLFPRLLYQGEVQSRACPYVDLKGGDAMTKEQFDRESNFRLAVAVFKKLFCEGLLTKTEFEKAREMLAARFNPPYGALKDVLASAT